MMKPGDVISYLEMCTQEGVSLQRGMNYRLRANNTVILMSLRPNAPYADRVEEDGHVFIFEGHDVSKTQDTPIPKIVDQPMNNPTGTLTQNGLFYKAAKNYCTRKKNPEFEKEQNIFLEHNRMIPPEVKLEVWKRDKGKCVKCGSTDNLHFDHIIPFSKGGSSLVAENIQILCARHNISKRDNIE